MKKIIFITTLFVLFLSNLNAQDTSFGVTAGFLNGSAKFEVGNESISDSEAGFYGGFFAEFGVSEKFSIQPSIVYGKVGEASLLQLPVLAKYYVLEKFNLLVGPQITYELQSNLDEQDLTNFNFGIGLGAGFDITENFLIETKYAVQLNNLYIGNADIKSTVNFFNIGLGYRF